MSGLLHRLTTAMKGGLDALLAPAEDPRRAYADTYERQRGLLDGVQQALAQNAALRQRLEARLSQMRERLPRLEGQARRSLSAGREDLARLALQQRQVSIMEMQALESQTHQIQLEEQRLALVEQRLAAHLETFHAKQEVLAARYSAAEAQVRLHEAFSTISDEWADLGLALERAEQQAEHMQARAAAIDRLVESGTLDVPGLPAGDLVAQQLAQLDVAQAVEEQLAALKAQDRGAGSLNTNT